MHRRAKQQGGDEHQGSAETHGEAWLGWGMRLHGLLRLRTRDGNPLDQSGRRKGFLEFACWGWTARFHGTVAADFVQWRSRP